MTIRLLILIVFFPILIYGQKDSSDLRVVIHGEPTITSRPELIIVIDKLNIRLDSITVKRINPQWIKKIEVIKEQKYKTIYGNNDGVVFIYPKNKYKKRILKLIGHE